MIELTRDNIITIFKSIFTSEELEILLDRIENCCNTDDFILHYHNETVLIYDTYYDLYLTWYKITHVGRSFTTNIKDIEILTVFLNDLRYDIMR